MSLADPMWNWSALRWVASTFGVLAGVGGLTHGVGEVRQGNVAPEAFFFPSWTDGPIASQMGGDPAISVVPNLLVAGVLTLVVSASLIVWAAAFVDRRRGGWVTVGLAVVLLLVGGGIGSPVVAFLAGLAGLGVGSRLPWWRGRLTGGLRSGLARLWPLAFGVATLNGLFLFVLAIPLVYLLGFGNADLFLGSFFLAVVTVTLAALTGVARDLGRAGQGSRL